MQQILNFESQPIDYMIKRTEKLFPQSFRSNGKSFIFYCVYNEFHVHSIFPFLLIQFEVEKALIK